MNSWQFALHKVYFQLHATKDNWIIIIIDNSIIATKDNSTTCTINLENTKLNLLWDESCFYYMLGMYTNSGMHFTMSM